MSINHKLFGLFLISVLSCTSPKESVEKENAIEFIINEHGDTLGQRIIKKQYGFASKEGKVIIEPQYDYFSDFTNGIAFVGIGKIIEGDSYENFEGKLGIIDSTGRILFSPQFDDIELDDHEIGVFRRNGKYGFFKTDGTFLTDSIFEDADLFYHDLARVKMKDKYGFIDTTGQITIPCIFDFANNFQKNKVSVVEMSGRFGIIDSKGNYVLKPTYDKIELFDDDIAYFKEKDLFGVLNFKGEVVQKAIFKDKVYVTENYERVCDVNDKWGLMDEHGKIVIDMQYDKIRPDPERTKISFWRGDHETTIDLVGGRLKTLN
jgi:serine/threonine-protein kinase